MTGHNNTPARGRGAAVRTSAPIVRRADDGWLPVTGEPVKPYLAHFAHRVLWDAIAEATARYWQRRADRFEAARPTAADHPGHATADDLADRDRRLAGIAQACRARAEVARTTVWEVDQ